MHKEFFQTVIFIVGMTLTLGAPPTIAMDDEEIPLTKHSTKVDSSKLPFDIDPANHYYRSMSVLDQSYRRMGGSLVENDEKVHLTDSYRSKFSPTLTILDQETSLTKHFVKKETENTNLKKSNPKNSLDDSLEEDEIESTYLKQSIKHIEP